MYDHSLHCRRKHFCRYMLVTFLSLHASITKEIFKRHKKIALKLMVNKELRYLRKVNMLISKILNEM